MRLYRYYVELLVLISKDGSIQPKRFRIDKNIMEIDAVDEVDRGYSRAGEFCRRYHCLCQKEKVILYQDPFNRFYVELPFYDEALMDPLDRKKYRIHKAALN